MTSTMASTLRLVQTLHARVLRPLPAHSRGLQVGRRAPRAGSSRALSTSVPIRAAHDDFLRHNQNYAAEKHEQHADLAVQPAKKLAVVACMDARINMLAHLGLKEGDAHIIRNAGGVAKDALRSLIVSQQMLGTREIALFHHTKCGMSTCTSHGVRQKAKETLPNADCVDEVEFLEFNDLEGSVKSDVEWLKEHPLILPETVITGWVYEVETGQIRRIV